MTQRTNPCPLLLSLLFPPRPAPSHFQTSSLQLRIKPPFQCNYSPGHFTGGLSGRAAVTLTCFSGWGLPGIPSPTATSRERHFGLVLAKTAAYEPGGLVWYQLCL